jgi:hypothetical protein
MGIFLAVVGVLSLAVLVALMVAFGKRIGQLTRSLTALQADLLPALEEVQRISDETQRLAKGLEERARVLRPDGG